MRAAVNGFCPECIFEVLTSVSVLPGRDALRSSTSGTLSIDVSRTRTEFGKRAISVAEPVVRNSLPPSLTDIRQLKRAL